MFFEDEKENNIENLEDFDLELDDSDDDESITWDELLKEDGDKLVSVKGAQNAEVKTETSKAKEVHNVEDDELLADVLSDVDTDSELEIEALDPDDTEIIIPDTDEPTKKDAFDVFGGDPEAIRHHKTRASLPEEQTPKEDEDNEDIYYFDPAKAQNNSNNIAKFAGLALALFLVIASSIYLFLGSHKQNTADYNELANQSVQTGVDMQNPGIAQLPKDGDVPVVNDANIQAAKKAAQNKKTVVLSVQDGGRSNPFAPTVNLDTSAYSSAPVDLLMPPDEYGNIKEAQKLMGITVSGILFDRVKPSAIVNLEGTDYFVQKGDKIDEYQIIDINPQVVVITYGKNIYRAGVGERFNQNQYFAGRARYQDGRFAGARQYPVYTSKDEVKVEVRDENPQPLEPGQGMPGQ